MLLLWTKYAARKHIAAKNESTVALLIFSILILSFLISIIDRILPIVLLLQMGQYIHCDFCIVLIFINCCC